MRNAGLSIAALLLVLLLAGSSSVATQAPRGVDWTAVERETLEHFQTVLRFDTSDPPGNERPAAEYL